MLGSQTSVKTLSTWGVIRGFDRAVAEMNCTFSNMLQELQKDEIKKMQREQDRQLQREQHKKELLQGKPFTFAT